MIERLDFTTSNYDALEAAIHMARYSLAMNICSGKDVLDLSCGQGYGSYLLSTWGAKSVVGVDIDDPTITVAGELFKRDHLSYICGNGENLFMFPDDSFDLIISCETIEHVPNPYIFLGELKRVLRNNGTLILTCPNDHYYFPEDTQSNPYHLRKYTLEEFENLVNPFFGKPSHMLFGMPLAGFVNIGESNNKYTSKTQMRMLEYENNDNAILLPSSKIDTNYSRYFAAVWSHDSSLKDFSSASFFPDVESKSYIEAFSAALIEELNDHKRALRQKIEDDEILRRELNNSQVALKQKIEDAEFLRSELIELKAHTAAIANERDFMLSNITRLKSELDLAMPSHLWLQTLYSRRSYKIFKKFQKLARFLLRRN